MCTHKTITIVNNKTIIHIYYIVQKGEVHKTLFLQNIQKIITNY